MFIGRVIGWLVVTAGLVFLVMDTITYANGGVWAPFDTGSALIRAGAIAPADLSHLQAGIQRYTWPWLWSDIVQPGLLWPLWLWLFGLGAGLLLVFRTRG